MTPKDWDELERLLIAVMDLDARSWADKKAILEEALSQRGVDALREISAWFE